MIPRRMTASASESEPMTRTYRFAMGACAPLIRAWGRLETRGVELLPTSGPVVLVGNHDSHWDPVAIGVAARSRRQIRALAKASLWDNKVLAPILDGMGQVPIHRGAGDADALETAIVQLRGGACIGVFPEGTISRGKTLRARSGVGRLALDVPEATLVCVAVTGTVDIVRFPRRPRMTAEFFLPESGQIDPTEDPTALSARCLAEIRAKAPIAVGGRKKTEAKWREAAEREEQSGEAESALG